MTSKISFSKLLRLEWNQLLWLTALQAVGFGLLIPFRLLVLLSKRTPWGQRELKNIISELGIALGMVDQGYGFTFLLAGIVCALSAFSYIFSQKRQDLYHSLPLKREAVFAVKYLAGVLTFIVSFGVAQVLAILIGMVYKVATGTFILETAISTVLLTLFFLCSYSMTIFAMMLTGKLVTGIFSAAAFAFYGPVLILLAEMFSDFFLSASLEWLETMGTRLFRYTSPWAFCLFSGEGAEVGARQGLTGTWPSAGGLSELTAIVVLLTLLSAALYRIRRTEAAGQALAFRWMEGPVKMLLAVPVALMGGGIAHIIYQQQAASLWELIFLALFSALPCLLMEFIYRWDIRQVLRHSWHAGIVLVISLLIFFGMKQDVFHYNTWLPAPESIEAMAVQDGRFRYMYRVGGEKGSASEETMREQLDQLETDQISILYPLAENGVQNIEQHTGSSESGVIRVEYLGDETYGENEEAQGRKSRIGVKFRLKNGKVVYRSYIVDNELLNRQLDLLLQDQAYRERFFPILSWSTEDVWLAECYLYNREIYEKLQEFRTEQNRKENGSGNAPDKWKPEENPTEPEEWYGLSEEELEEEYGTEETAIDGSSDELVEFYAAGAPVKELLLAYQEDLRSISFQEMMTENETVQDLIQFQLDEQQYTSWKREYYPITKDFQNTLRVMAEIMQKQGDAGL